MLMTLQFYKFNSTLQIMAAKYKSNVIFINEYKTSMTCHKCLKENRNLGGSHIFNCSGCNIEIGRDINASINIYNMGFLKQ
jgi:transposase